MSTQDLPSPRYPAAVLIKELPYVREAADARLQRVHPTAVLSSGVTDEHSASCYISVRALGTLSLVQTGPVTLPANLQQ